MKSATRWSAMMLGRFGSRHHDHIPSIHPAPSQADGVVAALQRVEAELQHLLKDVEALTKHNVGPRLAPAVASVHRIGQLAYDIGGALNAAGAPTLSTPLVSLGQGDFATEYDPPGSRPCVG